MENLLRRPKAEQDQRYGQQPLLLARHRPDVCEGSPHRRLATWHFAAFGREHDHGDVVEADRQHDGERCRGDEPVDPGDVVAEHALDEADGNHVLRGGPVFTPTFQTLTACTVVSMTSAANRLRLSAPNATTTPSMMGTTTAARAVALGTRKLSATAIAMPPMTIRAA